MTTTSPPVTKPEFKSIRGLAQWVYAIFVVQAILLSVLILTNNTAAELSSAKTLTDSEALTLLGILCIELLEITSYIASGVLFLVWLYRANSNLPVLGVATPKFTPRWAVGWFFIPVMSLFRPFQVVSEVWIASDPETASNRPYPTERSSQAWLVLLWWVFFLVSNYFSWWDVIVNTDTTMKAGYGINIAGIAITILLVWQISQHQHIKIDTLGRLS
jgi:hypothetical protein